MRNFEGELRMVDDIKKLRPELLEKSDAELDRMAAEIALARAHKAREAEVAAKEELAVEANRHIEAIVDGVKFLHDKGILPAKVASGFTRDGDGMFSPGMFLRAVTAESLLTSALGVKPRRNRDPNAPKRHRRSKAEVEAARAAGETRRRR